MKVVGDPADRPIITTSGTGYRAIEFGRGSVPYEFRNLVFRGIDAGDTVNGAGLYLVDYTPNGAVVSNCLFEACGAKQGAGFYFTESPMWNIKSMLSSHGTWAELRHDTILYVKQSAAERAGDGDFDPTFRTKPLPKPIHYIEPNIPFWQASINAVSSLLKIYSDYDLLDDESESSLTNLLDIYSSILEICEKEAKNKPISESENSWIPTIPSRLNKLIFVHTPNHDIIEDNDQIKMACIADVFSNYDFGVCLEVGVANPHKIFVPLNDSQGGKRIAVGFCFSYAEFTNPISDRLTDEQWKETVYRSQKNIEDFMPTWEKECLLKAPDDNF